MTVHHIGACGRLAHHLDARTADLGERSETGSAGRVERDDLVTRPVCLTGETFGQIFQDVERKQPSTVQVAHFGTESQRAIQARHLLPSEDAPPFFVDWLSISQTHACGALPLVDSGCVMAVDSDGTLTWKTSKAVQHEGSFETSCNVKCDGERVTFSGNVSRFGRAENLFGFGLVECFERVNSILAHYGLPAFSAGERIAFARKGDVNYAWTGARISRIDLTANFEAGSAEDAHAVMQYLGSQHAGRQEGRVLGAGETVAWGSGSRRQYWKAYIKHLELQRHGCEDPRVIEHCAERGVVRFEGTIRSNALTDLGCAFLGDYERGWAMGQLVNLFNEHTEVLTRAEQSTDDLDQLPKQLRATARDYLAGMDMAATMARATFYRHRKELLGFGFDIAVRNVTPFKPRVRVVQLRPASVPSWYQLAA